MIKMIFLLHIQHYARERSQRFHATSEHLNEAKTRNPTLIWLSGFREKGFATGISNGEEFQENCLQI